MKRRSFPVVLATIGVAVVAAIALLSAAAAPRQANAFPNKQTTCSSCHSGTPSGPVTATPSNATPAPNATYSVAVSVGLTAERRHRVLDRQLGRRRHHRHVDRRVRRPGSGTSYNPTMTAPGAPGTYYYKVWTAKGPNDSTGMAKAASYSITVAEPPAPTDTTAPTTTASGALDNGWYHLPVLVTLTATTTTAVAAWPRSPGRSTAAHPRPSPTTRRR